MHKHNKIIKIRFSIIFILLLVIFSASMFLLRDDVFVKEELIKNIESKEIESYLSSSDETRTMVYMSDKTYSKGDGIPVLLYHGIVEEDSVNGINISTDKFKEHMLSLRENSYNSINVKDLELYFMGEIDLPYNPIMITFDDGRRDSVVNGTSILKDNNLKAVMFINSLKQEDDDDFFLNWEEVNIMNNSNTWDIQSHGRYFHEDIIIDNNLTKGHFASNKMWLEEEGRVETDEEFEDRLRKDHEKELQELKLYVKDIDIIAFAFPFGDIGDGAINIDSEYAKAINIKVARDYYLLSFGENVDSGDVNFVYHYGEDPYNINRLSVSKDWTGDELISVLEKY